MREIARVLKPGGRVAIVTWTETGTLRARGTAAGRDHRSARAAASADSASCPIALPRRTGFAQAACRGRSDRRRSRAGWKSAGACRPRAGSPSASLRARHGRHGRRAWRPTARRCSMPSLPRSNKTKARARSGCRLLPRSASRRKPTRAGERRQITVVTDR